MVFPLLSLSPCRLLHCSWYATFSIPLNNVAVVMIVVVVTVVSVVIIVVVLALVSPFHLFYFVLFRGKMK